MKEIPLTQGKVALVDDADYEWLSQYNWFAHHERGRWYALRSIPRGHVKMHRAILGITSPDIKADHKNHNGLDNQRHNLRAATNQQNAANAKAQVGRSSKYKGVCWYSRYNKWHATIGPERKHLGYFNNEIDAAVAYDRAALARYGDFAGVNFHGGVLCSQ